MSTASPLPGEALLGTRPARGCLCCLRPEMDPPSSEGCRGLMFLIFTITAQNTFDIALLEGLRLSVVGRKMADLASPQGGNCFPPARICSSSGRETRGVSQTGTVGNSVTVGKACELGLVGGRQERAQLRFCPAATWQETRLLERRFAVRFLSFQRWILQTRKVSQGRAKWTQSFMSS